MRKNLLLLASSALLAVLLGEVIVRVAIAVLHREPIVVSDPHTGWANRPNLTALDVTVADGHFRLGTDTFGRRITYDSTLSVTASTPVVLLVGDSFMYGINVDDRDTFAWLVAQSMPDQHVINLGVPGWGTDQELVNLENFMESGGSKTVSDIVVLMFENDFRDVQRGFDPYLARSKPVFHVNEGMLNRGGQFGLSPLDRLMDPSRLAWLIRSKAAGLRKPRRIESAAGVEVVLACLGAIRRLGEASGARVHLFAYRRPDTATVKDSVWRSFVHRAGAVDLTDKIRTAGQSAIGFDGVHWSAEGHRQVGPLIRESIRTPPGG